MNNKTVKYMIKYFKNKAIKTLFIYKLKFKIVYIYNYE